MRVKIVTTARAVVAKEALEQRAAKTEKLAETFSPAHGTRLRADVVTTAVWAIVQRKRVAPLVGRHIRSQYLCREEATENLELH